MDVSRSTLRVDWQKLRLWLGFLARGAQQQAGQREERQGEKAGKDCLLHAGTISE
jgi:hypothetical protein